MLASAAGRASAGPKNDLAMRADDAGLKPALDAVPIERADRHSKYQRLAIYLTAHVAVP